MRECVIDIEHLQKRYPEAMPLMDVCTKIYKGDVIAVIGPSGTGKSTLLRCINRLETPTSGKITVLGADVTDKSTDPTLIRQKMGMVFQSFNLFDHLTCLENIIAAPVDLKKIPREQAVKRAKELLEAVGLEGREEAFPSELSGGQKQRAAIARTLAMDPEIILLDEPTSALDPTMVQEVEKVIRQIAESGTTMMIVTHEMKFAREVSNRVFFMCEGEIYEEGSPEEIFEHPKREKTLEFINNCRILRIDIDFRSFEMEEIMRKMHDYFVKNGVETKRILRAENIFEEIVEVNLREYYPDISDMRMDLSVGKEISLTFTYTGEKMDPFEKMDEISSKIVEKFAKCSYEYHDHINEISCIL